MHRTLILLLTGLALVPSLAAQPVFREVSRAAGIRHFSLAGDLMGGGVAWLDYDRDGFEDLYLTGGIGPDKLFRNLGNGTFSDVTAAAGGFRETGIAKTMGVVTGDINNDGYRDIFVTTARDERNLLYLNNGNGTFSEISQPAGITHQATSASACFLDVNLDGYLDIFVTNHINRPVSVFDAGNNVVGFAHDCFPDYLYLNNRDNTFTESAVAYGVADKGCGLAVAATDYNGDGRPDLYVANDFGEWVGPNRLYQNAYPGAAFTDVAAATGTDAAIYGMGVAVGDYDNDGRPDYFVTNLGRNVLYRNKGDGKFADAADAAGVSNEKNGNAKNVGWGTAFFDYDHDGWQDLFVSNGYLLTNSRLIETARDNPNKLYRNGGGGTFGDVTEAAGVGDPGINRGMAVADYDNDGDPDFFVSKVSFTANSPENSLLYQNARAQPGRWLKVKLEGVQCNRDAFGSRVVAYQNGKSWLREIDGGSSYGSQNSAYAHFGLGDLPALDSLTVVWTGGKQQTFGPVETNQTIYVREDAAAFAVVGCTDPGAANYNARATYPGGCRPVVRGCTDAEATNFDAAATADDGSCQYPVTALQPSTNDRLTVHPNPLSDRALFRLPAAPAVQQVRLHLYNAVGRLVRTAAYGRVEAFTLDKGGLPPGLYTYRLTVNGEKIMYGRIVIQ